MREPVAAAQMGPSTPQARPSARRPHIRHVPSSTRFGMTQFAEGLSAMRNRSICLLVRVIARTNQRT